ncbi:hypothetical protein [Amycolatopsis albispora]|uniref:hypothetical protein n=1 Tax=Amycolatopsis albispora TaxID=1804986 RepID=UPI0013B3ED48|nr:hypothetical protein [Amycolatopsis albispora]
MKMALLGSAVALIASVAVASPAAASEAENIVTPHATCNYVVNSHTMNAHADKDRSSPIKGTYNHGHIFYGLTCANQTGGKYSTCGPSDLWKASRYGWLPTKCLTRV